MDMGSTSAILCITEVMQELTNDEVVWGKPSKLYKYNRAKCGSEHRAMDPQVAIEDQNMLVQQLRATIRQLSLRNAALEQRWNHMKCHYASLNDKFEEQECTTGQHQKALLLSAYSDLSLNENDHKDLNRSVDTELPTGLTPLSRMSV